MPPVRGPRRRWPSARHGLTGDLEDDAVDAESPAVAVKTTWAMARVWLAPTTWIGVGGEVDGGDPAADRGRHHGLVGVRKLWSPLADSWPVGPSSSALEDLGEVPLSVVDRDVPGHRGQVWVGATRKIGSGTATARGRVDRGRGGAGRAEQVEGHVLLGMAVGGRLVGMPQAAVARADDSAPGRPAHAARGGPVRPARRLHRRRDASSRGPGAARRRSGNPGPGRPRSRWPRRAGGRARPPGRARGRCPRSTPADRPGCHGRSARRDGCGRLGARRGPGPPRSPGCCGPASPGSAG